MSNPYRYGDRIEQVVAFHAELRPEAVAVEQGANTLTYGALIRRSDSVAEGLRNAGAGSGSVVVTRMRRSPELVIALLAIMRAGAAYVAMDPSWPQSRQDEVISRAKPVAVLADDDYVGGLPEVAQSFAQMEGSETLLSSHVIVPPEVCGGEEAACIFYTSGSTGAPKGVMSPHRGTIRTLVDCPTLPLGRSTVFLQAAPLPWDGLSLELWAPLLNGGRVVLLEQEHTVVDGAVLRSLVGRGVNSLWLTSSLFSVLADEDPEVFSGLRLLLVGGERVSPMPVRRVLNLFPDLRVVNGYGPAESTIFATTHVIRPADVAEGAKEIPIGRPVPRTTIALVDEQGCPVEIGTVGEILIGGDGLALGYLGDKAETRRRFLNTSDGKIPPGRYYRSGDLALVDAEGILRYRGRADRQFKIRGVRIEPGEVEAVLESCPVISSCSVLRFEDVDDRPLLGCAYTTTSGLAIDEREIRDYAAHRLLNAMVPSLFLHVDRMPLGSTGKTDDKALRAIFESHLAALATRAASARGNASVDEEADAALQEAREVLMVPGLASDQDLLTVGATSLDLVRLSARLSRRLEQRITVGDIYECRTLARIRTRGADQRKYPALPSTVSGACEGPLSHAQRRFLFAEYAQPGAHDNIFVLTYVVTGAADESLLKTALRDVVARHSILRTTYETQGHHLVQRVQPTSEVSLRIETFSAGESDTTDEATAASHITADWWDESFDLSSDLPMQVRLCRLDSERLLLCLKFHHIAFDGWSEQIFLDDLMTAYRARLNGLAPQGESAPSFIDYSRWELETVEAWLADDIDYWRALTSEPPPPFLKPAPARGDVRREEFAVRVPRTAVACLEAVARRHGSPPLAVLVAAVGTAFARVFQVSDLCLGSVTAGRSDPVTENLIGYFVNPFPLVLRSLRSGDPDRALRISSQAVVSALRHTRTPFDRIVRELRPDRSRHPWFQAWVVMQKPLPIASMDAELQFVPLRVSAPRTADEWMLECFPTREGEWDLHVHWRQDALDAEQAQQVVRGVLDFLDALVTGPEGGRAAKFADALSSRTAKWD